MELNFGNSIDFSSTSAKTEKIHIRLQTQGKRKLTIIQDLDSDLDLIRICKNMKKIFSCNGAVIDDEKMGQIIQLQGDHREAVQKWLIENEIVSGSDDRIVIHGA